MLNEVVYIMIPTPTCRPTAVLENTYFTFFSDFKKNMTFYVFLKWHFKKS